MRLTQTAKKNESWLVIIGLMILVPLMLAIACAKDEVSHTKPTDKGLDKNEEKDTLTLQN